MDYKSQGRKAGYLLLAVIGTVFCLWYVKQAGGNVAYSDYIRLIISYIPDVTNPYKFLVPDILTRVPITYLVRIFNVKFFGYSTWIDMGLGVASMGLGAAAIAWYCGEKKEINPVAVIIAMVIYFGLNKWEMLLNGTGWVCFLSISGFLVHFIVLDHSVYTSFSHKWDRILLCILPPVIILLVAGPYCAGYAGVLMLFYMGIIIKDMRSGVGINKPVVKAFASVAVSMALYLLSNHFAVYEIRDAEAAGQSIITGFLSDPAFFFRFGLKALASAVVGEAQWDSLMAAASAEGSFVGNKHIVFIAGALVFAAYLLALYWTVKYRIYEKTIMPLILLISGGADHILVLMARWIFLHDSYGMSSRYELQYQLGILGILLTIGYVITEIKGLKTKRGSLVISVIIMAAVLGGSLWTTVRELDMAKYRKHFIIEARDIGVNYREASDEDLHTYFQHDPEKVRQALGILEENHLNIFAK